MDFALNSILFFVFLVYPGIVFRRFYFSGEFSKQFNAVSVINTTYQSVIPSIPIQLLSYHVFTKFFYKKEIKSNEILEFISILKLNNITGKYLNMEFIYWILLYIIINVVLAILFAVLIRQLVRKARLDHKFSLLRFHNYWHYYLSGESIYFDAFKNNYRGKEVALTEADILVDLGNGLNKLYKGIVTQHTICRSTGDLKLIYLTQCRRYKIIENENSENTVIIKDVPGDIMLIPNEKIINMNLRYITRDKEKIDYLSIFTGILGILFIFISFIDPFSFLGNKLTIIGWILGRFWLIILSIFIVALFDNIFRKDIKHSIKFKFFQSITFMIQICIIISIISFFFRDDNLLLVFTNYLKGVVSNFF